MGSLLEQLKTISDETVILGLDEREFKAVLGLSPQAFVKLLGSFAESAAELKQNAEASRARPRQRKVGGGRKPTLCSMASQLGFLLQYFKRYDTLDALGDQVGFHRSNVSRNLQALLAVLLHTLAKLQVLPPRTLASPAELEAAFAGVEALVIDATERPILRPQEATDQKKAIAPKSIKMP